MKKLVFILTLSMFLTLKVNASTEDSIILDLSERLAHKATEFQQKQAQLDSLKPHQDRANQAYEEVLKAEKGTPDHSYAVANLVNARLVAIEPKIRVVDDLQGITHSIGNDLQRLARAVEMRGQGSGFSKSNRELAKIAQTFEGTDAILSAINSDPIVARDPSIRLLSDTFRTQRRLLVTSSSNNNISQGEEIQRILDVVDTQTALLATIQSHLRNEIDSIKMIQVGTTTASMTREIYNVLDSLYGTISGMSHGPDAWSDRYRKIMDDTLYTSTSSPIGGPAFSKEDNLRERNAMRRALGQPEISE